jgi:hypothetical protein
VFSDPRLNETIKTILELDECRQSMSRAIGHLFHVFFSRQQLFHQYMPGKYTAPPTTANYRLPAENYKAFYQVFMHLLGFKDSNEFDESYLCRQIFAATQNFRSSRKKHPLVPSNKANSAAPKRRHSILSDESMKSQNQFSTNLVDSNHQREYLHVRKYTFVANGSQSDPRQHLPFTFAERLQMTQRMEEMLAVPIYNSFGDLSSSQWFDYQTEGRIYQLEFFEDEYMDEMLQEILMRPDSIATISQVTQNVAKILWCKQDVQGKRARAYKHRARFDVLFMHVLGFSNIDDLKKSPMYYRVLQKLVTMKW